jgi:hypothetical protein
MVEPVLRHAGKVTVAAVLFAVAAVVISLYVSAAGAWAFLALLVAVVVVGAVVSAVLFRRTRNVWALLMVPALVGGSAAGVASEQVWLWGDRTGSSDRAHGGDRLQPPMASDHGRGLDCRDASRFSACCPELDTAHLRLRLPAERRSPI